MAAGNVEYTRIEPEAAVYNAYTGNDEKLYEREINAGSYLMRQQRAGFSGCLLKTILPARI